MYSYSEGIVIDAETNKETKEICIYGYNNWTPSYEGTPFLSDEEDVIENNSKNEELVEFLKSKNIPLCYEEEKNKERQVMEVIICQNEQLKTVFEIKYLTYGEYNLVCVHDYYDQRTAETPEEVLSNFEKLNINEIL